MSLFGKVTVIGIGLIGSSLARVIKRDMDFPNQSNRVTDIFD